MNLLRKIGCGRSALGPLLACSLNLLLLYVVYSLLRVEFLVENLSFFHAAVSEGRVWQLLLAGPVFDTPGILYTNALWLLMMLLPLHWKERPTYYRVCRWVFVVINSLAIAANLADSVYFPYSLKRTAWDVFSEFSNDNNILKIASTEALHHWYLLLLWALLTFLLWKFYSTPEPGANTRPRWRYYLLGVASLAVGGLTAVTGIRGGLLNHWWHYVIAFPLAYAAWRLWRASLQKRRLRIPAAICGVSALLLLATAPIGGWRHRDIRPIALSNAAKYIGQPNETALVLNTPFTLIRTIGSTPYFHPGYFATEAELEQVYTPLHQAPLYLDSISGKPTAPGRGKNVVVIILESFGREYFGSLNHDILGPDYRGYTPFLDSLVSVSATWHYSFDNGTKSIDAMPSILAGIPRFVRPFVLTPAAMNRVRGIPALLADEGYSTAFFHGARTGSMGFDGFARSVGFADYYGREDFVADGRAGGEEEFDGYWAIWDEPFLQYFALKLTDMKPPFMAALFSASSHHPFHVPERYAERFPEEQPLPIYKTIRYTDNALREFFATARRQPWYDNTIFVITNDHTNQRAYDEYRSDIGIFYGPLIIFDPSGGIAAGEREGVAQQTDIMPTLLNYLGVQQGYVAFGSDLLRDAPEELWAVSNINDVYQYVRYGYVAQYDGKRLTGIYRLGDHLMANNLLGKNEELERRMQRELEAIIQQYMDRMLTDRLTADSGAGH